MVVMHDTTSRPTQRPPVPDRVAGECSYYLGRVERRAKVIQDGDAQAPRDELAMKSLDVN
jgi:hypothetical protein